MPDLECRVAKLEQAVEELRDMIIEDRNEHRRKMDKIYDAISDLKMTMDKQHGFVGGVVFTAGAIFSVLTWFLSSKFGSPS